jgi:transposase-like protein
MTKTEAKPAIAPVNELFAKSPDGLREIVRAVMQEMLEAEMTDALGAGKGERTGARLAKWGVRYPKLVSWVEETIEETLAFYRLPRRRHKHLKSANMHERVNEEIRRRTHVVRRHLKNPRQKCPQNRSTPPT